MNDRQPMFNVPRSVLIALGLVLAVHLLRISLGEEEGLRLLLALAFIPARYAANAPVLPGGETADFTSFVTYMFVHANWVHLIVNSIWMLAFGSAVAQRVGDLRFALFSLLCGVAGAALHLALHFGELVPVVGASAAISGQFAGAIRFVFSVSGSGFGRDPQALRSVPLAPIWVTLQNPRILIFIVVWVGLNFLFGAGVGNFAGEGGSIAWEAHLGGFVVGLLTFGLFDRPFRRPASSALL